MSLNKKEIRVLKLIDANVRGNHKANVTSYLRNQLGLPNDIANKIYALWVLNFRKDGKYEEIEEANRDTQPILNFLKKIQQDEMYDDEIPERFFGSMNFCKGSYGGYYSRSSWNTPCISIDSDNVTFRLGQDFGEYTEITGLYSDDAWMYSEAHSNYSDYYDEYDSEEFNYVNFNDETLELVKKIAILTKNNEALNYLNSTDNVDSERLARYLENMLHDEDFDYIVNDYLYEIGYITGNERRSAVRDYYGEAITYPLDENDGYAIEIPIEEVIEKIEDGNILTIDELAEVEFQDALDLESTWYDAGYWSSDSNDHIDNLNSNLEDIVDKYDDGQYDEYIESKEYFDNILNKLGVEPYAGLTGAKKYYTLHDGRLHFNTNDIDYGNRKIKFYYDDKAHIVPFDDFVPWLQGSVLDLKNESIRYGRVLIMEEKQTINKISIFDFDGTLADTPNKEDGIAIWEAKNKKDYPHRGWWGKEESLDENTFKVKLIPTTKDDYDRESEGDNTLMVMLTGRIPKLADQVESILNKNGVIFDEYHYKERGDTFTSKINTIKRLLEQNPNVKEIEMWEDRLTHADGFEEWGNANDIDIKVNRVII